MQYKTSFIRPDPHLSRFQQLPRSCSLQKIPSKVHIVQSLGLASSVTNFLPLNLEVLEDYKLVIIGCRMTIIWARPVLASDKDSSSWAGNHRHEDVPGTVCEIAHLSHCWWCQHRPLGQMVSPGFSTESYYSSFVINKYFMEILLRPHPTTS